MKGNGEAQLSYRLLLAVDIQGYSRRDTREQLRAQRLLSDALDRAARGVGLDRAGLGQAGRRGRGARHTAGRGRPGDGGPATS
ncbi:hypothetical protein [Actinomadura madurae]|uniref:hypothetical protein n=1 Tax=Actinomadura madurae TaxID=1993 RepID=UPI0020D25FA7|nr:hypothetical protein [Actinomadura madurae]MCQ0014075.1 hypothetical protein [Actinomadura madurae]